MDITLEQLISFGYLVPAASVDAWRTYDEQAPIPNYFDFDWLSSRHPDLYHKFALSTLGLMHELDRLVDLSGLDVLEVAAGTGRAAIEAGRKAHRVTAIDIFPSVICFGKEMVRQAGLGNVDYARADCNHLPFPDDTFDACISSWAILSFTEAYRVLKPGGYLIWLGPAPGALCGELTATLASVFPEIITEIAPDDYYDPACPDSDAALQDATWNGLQVTPPTLLHDFTYTADYGDCLEAAAIFGRLYGPAARRYMLDRQQSKFSWRLRIEIVRVSK
jgi:ubiquinone/menaquinone biosynthesis C-methylase UbiE